MSSKIVNTQPELERHGNNSTLTDQYIWLYLVIVVCAFILASPSLVNGFPYIFPDSLGYLGLAATAVSKAMAFRFGAVPQPPHQHGEQASAAEGHQERSVWCVEAVGAAARREGTHGGTKVTKPANDRAYSGV